MAVSYTCPNPDCGVTLKTPNRVPAGKAVKCPKCGKPFVPEAGGEPPAAGTFKMADDPKPAAPPPPPPGPPMMTPGMKARADEADDEDAESVKKGYGMVQETAAEKEEADKHKPAFTDVEDKFKKSARGPAIALLVMPVKLLTFEGLVTCIGGLVVFMIGLWPLVFNDAPPGDEEIEEALLTMFMGLVAFGWGALVLIGTSQMQEVSSYAWAMAGAVMGVIPLLVGLFALMMLMNPKVKAGFEEGEGGPDEDDEDDEEAEKDEDEDEEEEDEEEDEDERPKKKRK